jgi:hypothetical protein
MAFQYISSSDGCPGGSKSKVSLNVSARVTEIVGVAVTTKF